MMERYGMADCDNKLHRLQQLTYRVVAASNPIPLLLFRLKIIFPGILKQGREVFMKI
jgi:hypothetical protein